MMGEFETQIKLLVQNRSSIGEPILVSPGGIRAMLKVVEEARQEFPNIMNKDFWMDSIDFTKEDLLRWGGTNGIWLLFNSGKYCIEVLKTLEKWFGKEKT